MLEWAFVRYVFALIGLVYLITEAGITMEPRILICRLAKRLGPRVDAYVTTLLYCAACVGFWVGIILGLLDWWPFKTGAWTILESGISAMAIATTWSKLTGGNGAFGAEAPLRGDNDEAQQTQAVTVTED